MIHGNDKVPDKCWKRSTNACHTREGTTIEFARSKIGHGEIPTYQRMSPLFLAENGVSR